MGHEVRDGLAFMGEGAGINHALGSHLSVKVSVLRQACQGRAGLAQRTAVVPVRVLVAVLGPAMMHVT